MSGEPGTNRQRSELFFCNLADAAAHQSQGVPGLVAQGHHEGAELVIFFLRAFDLPRAR
jgi:hypothetical protein